MKILLILMLLITLTGCSYYDVSDDPNYVELYPDKNSGWYMNTEQPTLVVNESFVIPLLRDERIIAKWLINDKLIFVVSPDNRIYNNDLLIGEWHWVTTDTILVVTYPITDNSVSLLRVSFVDGSDNLAIFTELVGDSPYLGIKIE